MLRLTKVQLKSNKELLKMVVNTKLARAKAMSVASAVTKNLESTLKKELEGVETFLGANKREKLASNQDLLAMQHVNLATT